MAGFCSICGREYRAGESMVGLSLHRGLVKGDGSVEKFTNMELRSYCEYCVKMIDELVVNVAGYASALPTLADWEHGCDALNEEIIRKLSKKEERAERKDILIYAGLTEEQAERALDEEDSDEKRTENK